MTHLPINGGDRRLSALIGQIVAACARRPWLVIVVASALESWYVPYAPPTMSAKLFSQFSRSKSVEPM